MKIVLVGGGTGGHFYPLMAVAEAVAASGAHAQLYYMGPSPYDKAALEEHKIRYINCPAGKLRNYFSIQNFLDVFKNFFGVLIALWKLYWLYPDVVFSKGGFTSVPVLLAARFLMIPVVIHESDAVPGRANKLAAPFAKYIAIAHDDAAQFFPSKKTALVGIPIRKELTTPIADPFAELGIPNDKPLIYITGGSLGAESLNNVVLRSLTELLPHYRIFHQTGPTKFEDMQLAAQSLLTDVNLQNSYYLHASLPARTVALLMSAASLVVTRAGSTTLFELAYFGTPSIVIPIPEDISRDQRSNAYAYARGGAAEVIENKNLTPHLLVQEIQAIIGDPNRRASMSAAAKQVFIPDAAQKIAELLVQIGKDHGS